MAGLGLGLTENLGGTLQDTTKHSLGERSGFIVQIRSCTVQCSPGVDLEFKDLQRVMYVMKLDAETPSNLIHARKAPQNQILPVVLYRYGINYLGNTVQPTSHNATKNSS